MNKQMTVGATNEQNSYLRAMTVGFIWLAFITPASASLLDAINALNPGDKYRVLFATTTLTDGRSSDINIYNSIVAEDASVGTVTGSLGLTWKALVSTSAVNAQDNAGILNSDVTSVSIFNTLGQLVATSGFDFFHPVPNALAPRIEDQNGAAGGFFVATGTLIDGSTAPDGYLGHSNGASPEFVYGINVPDRPEIRLQFSVGHADTPIYGLSSIAEIATPIPVPAALPLLSIALAGLGFIGRRAT